MLVAQQPVALGVLWYTLIAIAPVVLLWLGLRIPRMVAAVRRRRAARSREQVPQGLPIERLALDLWRLRSELLTQPPANYVRRTALLSAYDSVLAATCARLEIRTELGSVSSWQDLELERLRAEAAIEQAGLPLVRP
jgi:hypothetical protein